MSYFVPDSRFEAPELLTPKRKPNRQVRIDWSNSLTRELGQCFCPIPSAPEEKVTGLMPSVMNGDWEGTQEGIGFRTASDGEYIQFAYHKNQEVNGDFTLWWRGKIYGEVAGAMSFMGNGVGALSAGEWFMFAIGDLSTDAFRLRFSNGTFVNLLDNGNNWPGVHPDLYDIYVTQKNTGTWTLYLYNGDTFHTETETNSTPFPFTAATNPLYINEITTTVNNSIDAVYLCGGIWHRALSDSEILSLNKDPYQFLIPA